MIKIEELISEMQAVKVAHPSLELHDILRIFNIHSIQELTREIRRHGR